MGKLLQWFVPKEDKFFKILRKQSENVLQGAEIFKELMNNFSTLSARERKELTEKIKEHENIGDDITHHLIETLNKSFITPFDKEDIHNVAILLDDIIDLINVAALKIHLYEIKVITPEMKDLTRLSVEAAKEVGNVVMHLRNLKSTKEHAVKVHTLENEADILYHRMLGELFKGKKSAIEIIKLREIYNILESITDKCEHTMHVFDAIVVKHV